MKIANKIISQLLEDGDIRAKICAALNASYHSVQGYCHSNEVNGPLTKVIVLQIICKELKVSQEEVLVRAKAITSK